MMALMFTLLYCSHLVPISTGSPAPSLSPTPARTMFPTMILQTQLDIFVSLKTTPQVQVSTFRTRYRGSIERAIVDILVLPRPVTMLGKVLLDEVSLNSPMGFASTTSRKKPDPIYTTTGAKCSLPSSLVNDVSVKISIIIENVGFQNRSDAFLKMSKMLASATDSGRMQNLTNQYIARLNPGKGFSPLNVSCFFSTSSSSVQQILRSPEPTLSPTFEPDAHGPKRYTLVICMTTILFVGLSVMAIASIADTHDQTGENLKRARAQNGTSGADEQFSETFVGENAAEMVPRNKSRTPSVQKLEDAVMIIKSAIPYIEYIQEADIMRAHRSTCLSPNEETGVSTLPWTRRFCSFWGIHDSSIGENIWLQHRWCSVLFYSEHRSRALRLFAVLYLTIMMLCFICLLVLKTDFLPPARNVSNPFMLDLIILCCIAALVSSFGYGFIELFIFYSFGATASSNESVEIMPTKSDSPDLAFPGASSRSNWQSISIIHSEEFDLAANIGDTFEKKKSNRVAPERTVNSSPKQRSTPIERSSLTAKLGMSRRQHSIRPASNIPSSPASRSPSSRRPESFGRRNGNNRDFPIEDTSEVVPAAILELLKSCMSAEEYLCSEPLIDELVRLQDNLLSCRDAIHSTCYQYRIPAALQLEDGNGNLDESELAIEDATLAVQFDANWGLNENGSILEDSVVQSESDGIPVLQLWKRYVSDRFTNYRGEVSEPMINQKSRSCPLLVLAADLVRARRQVLLEQLRLYSDIVQLEDMKVHQLSRLRSEGFASSEIRLEMMANDLKSLYTIHYLHPGDSLIKARRRVVQLFHTEVLPPLSSVIVKNQIYRHRWLTEKLYTSKMLKICGSAILILSCICMTVFIFKFGFDVFNKKQSSILIVFLSWLVLDVFVVETLSVLVRHVLMPSFAHQDVSEVLRWLLINTFERVSNLLPTDSRSRISHMPNGDAPVKPVLLGEIVPQGANLKTFFTFNAAKHLFVSVRLASLSTLTHSFIEAVTISEFHTLWPKRSYYCDHGARNEFGYMNHTGVHLFREPSASSQLDSISQSNVLEDGVKVVDVSADSVSQWIPEPGVTMMSENDSAYFRFIFVWSSMKKFVLHCAILFIDCLPLICQNVLIDYFIWGFVLWLLFVSVYVINTIGSLIVLPAMAVLLANLVWISLLKNKNKMGLGVKELEIQENLIESLIQSDSITRHPFGDDHPFREILIAERPGTYHSEGSAEFAGEQTASNNNVPPNSGQSERIDYRSTPEDEEKNANFETDADESVYVDDENENDSDEDSFHVSPIADLFFSRPQTAATTASEAEDQSARDYYNHGVIDNFIDRGALLAEGNPSKVTVRSANQDKKAAQSTVHNDSFGDRPVSAPAIAPPQSGLLLRSRTGGENQKSYANRGKRHAHDNYLPESSPYEDQKVVSASAQDRNRALSPSTAHHLAHSTPLVRPPVISFDARPPVPDSSLTQKVSAPLDWFEQVDAREGEESVQSDYNRDLTSARSSELGEAQVEYEPPEEQQNTDLQTEGIIFTKSRFGKSN